MENAEIIMDINYYYLGTPLPIYEYIQILLSRFPEEIIDKYNLRAMSVDGWVYIEIRKGMYGLKQAGLLVNQLLQKLLAPFGSCATYIWCLVTKNEANSIFTHCG
jgi:hypothetical protein